MFQLTCRKNCSSVTGALPAPDYEREALCDLYMSTHGEDWIWGQDNGVQWNCTGDSDPCANQWEGINCGAQTSTTSHVTSIDLSAYNLRGRLPSSLGNLSYLEVLDLETNSITGTIPLPFARLHQIVSIYLDDNALTGTIPTIFANLTLLSNLLFEYNRLTGTLPSELFTLPTLTTINVGGNYLHGTVPSALLPGAARLQLFNLNNNQFSGSLPPELGNMSSIQQLAFNDNLFTHTIPNTLAYYNSCQYIGLYNNLLTGTIPDVFGNAVLLHALDIQHNQLTGSIPGNFRYLQRLSVDHNQLTGSLPAEFTTWPFLTQLSASRNRLTGSLPENIAALQLLTFFYVDDNYLTGTIPSGLGAIRGLVSLNLSYNALSGSIPRSFVNVSDLSVLLLHHNALTGTLTGLFNATGQHNFTAIQVSNNQLTGQIPAEIFGLRQLTVFAAVSNCFHGTLPLSICNSTSLVTLALDGLQSATSCRSNLLPGFHSAYTVSNSIYQGVPSCLFHMHSLRTLHLSGNGLTGSLPDTEISPVLTELSLSHNFLRGGIPEAFQHHGWTSLDLSYNQLSGSLLNDFTAADNSTLTLEQNRISGNILTTMRTVEDISILGSNLFSCDSFHNDLPDHNPDRDNYECGSAAFDAGAYTWLALVCCTAATLALMVADKGRARGSCVSRWLMPSTLYEWWNVGCGDLQENNTTGDKQQSLRHYSAVCRTFLMVCNAAGASAAVIVVVLLPLYTALSHHYGTLLHQYAWTVSAAYLSGYASFSALLIAYIVGLGMFLALFLYLLQRRNGASPVQQKRSGDNHDVNGARIPNTTHVLICAVFVVFNFTIVGGVNVAYVYASLRASNSVRVVVQLLLSVFKLGFNRFCAPAFLRVVAQKVYARSTGTKGLTFSAAQFVSVQLLVTLINNIAIPCVVVAAVSPSCFVTVFKAAPTVTSTFSYDGACLSEAQPGQNDDGIAIDCVLYSIVDETTTYNPPFQYSYQCSSSIITYYAPALVNMCLIATFAVPLGQALGQHLYYRAQPGSSWHRLLSVGVPRLLQPLPPAESLLLPNGASYFAASLQLVSLLNHLGLLLTFGVVFPPLAVFFAVTILASTAHARLKVGRFLSLAKQLGRADCVATIERECTEVGTDVELRRAVRMIVSVSCMFYGLFLFDTLADDVGFAGAYWVLLVMLFLPLGFMAVYQALLLWQGTGDRTHSDTMQHAGTQGNSSSATRGAGGKVVSGTAATTALSAVEKTEKDADSQVETLSALHEVL
jgi:Leucine-rich repeat (LRR) protein